MANHTTYPTYELHWAVTENQNTYGGWYVHNDDPTWDGRRLPPIALRMGLVEPADGSSPYTEVRAWTPGSPEDPRASKPEDAYISEQPVEVWQAGQDDPEVRRAALALAGAQALQRREASLVFAG